MVVRLKDLESDTSSPTKKKGLVRLSDLKPENSYTEATPDEAAAHRIYEQQMKKAFQSNPESFLNPTDTPAEVQETPKVKSWQDDPSRQLPVIGPILRGLDAFANNKVVEKVGDIGLSLYTPGAGLTNIAGLTGAAEAAVAKTFPRLVGSTTGRIAQKGISEAIVGAPLGAASAQIMNPDASAGEIVRNTLIGAGTGGALGMLGRGAVMYGQKAAADLGENAIRNVSRVDRSVQSPFAEGASPSNAIANSYTSTVARTFGNAARNTDLPVPTPRPPVSSVTESNGLVIPNFLLRNRRGVEEAAVPPTQPPDIAPPTISETPAPRGIRGNYQNQLDNGNFSPELQSGIRRTDQSYDIATNASSVAKANENVKNMSEAEARFLNNESGGPDHIATGYRLMQELDALGKHEQALAVANKLAADLTKSGQTSQAASIISRLSPDGQLLNLIRTAERNGKTVSTADSVKFKELAAQVQAKSGAGIRANEFNAILNRLERGENVTVDEVNKLAKFLSGAEDTIKPKGKAPVIKDQLPDEFKEPRKRERVISYLDEAEQAALARIAARKNRLNSLPIDEWKDHAIVVASQMAKGTIKAATHIEDLVRMFGEEIRPVASQVFQSAQKLVTGVSRGAAEGNLERANEVLHRLSGQAAAEKELIRETSDHVRKLINDAKTGKLDSNDVQTLRDYSDEIAEILESNTKTKHIPSQEDRFMQTVKSLAKKIAQVESENIPADQANREVSSLLRQVVKLSEDMNPAIKKEPIDNKALSDIAHDVMEKTRPSIKRSDKETVSKAADLVRKVIEDSKSGKLDANDVQKLREYSDEIAEINKDVKPRKVPTQEEKFIQSVRALSKKIAKVETEKIPSDQANREISSLIRQVTNIVEEGNPVVSKTPIDNEALSNIAHDVMTKTRPNPKPKTLQEKIVEKYIKDNQNVSPKDIDTLRELAKNVTRLSGDQKIEADIAMQKILNSYEKSSAWDKILAMRYIGMLLNTHTQSINALSGPIMANTGLVADIFGTMLDISMNKILKTPRTTTLYGTNPLRFITGYLKNLKIGGKAGAQGVNPAGIQGTNEIRGLAFKSLKNPLGLAERALGAVAKGPDFATYKTVFDSEMRKQGFLSAKNQGIKGKANIDNHVREFVNNPPEEAILQADRIGKNTTFQRSDTTGGKVANYLNNAPALVKPGVNAIFPFVRTPVNIASTAVTMTPAGIIKGLFQLTRPDKVSQREAIRTLSLGVTGTGIGAIGYYLSQLGIITGANDSGDKDVDNIREQAGKGKYRFNTSALQRYLVAMLDGKGSEAAEKAAKYQKGDKQFDYNKLQPLAFPLAIGAGANDNKEKGAAGQASGAGADAFGSLFGMSTLKGVQNVFQPSYGGSQGEKALGVPSRIAESFFKSFSQGGLAQEAKRQDPIQRKTPFNDGIVKNTTDYFKSRTPGLSQSLPARKTTLGEDYKNAPGIKGAYFNPYRSEVAPYNEAAAIISELIDRTGDKTLAPSAPEKSVSGKSKVGGKPITVKIPPDRYAKLQEDVGRQIIEKVLAIPATLSDDKKVLKIKDIYKDVRAKESDKLKREYGIRID